MNYHTISQIINMRYTAAYLLAILGSNASPDVADIAKILGSVGIECDEKRAQQVIDACKGQNVNEIIANGMAKMDVALANTATGNSAGQQNIPITVPSTRSRSSSSSTNSYGCDCDCSDFSPVSSYCLYSSIYFLFTSHRDTYLINGTLTISNKIRNRQELQVIILHFIFCCTLPKIKYRLILSSDFYNLYTFRKQKSQILTKHENNF